MEALIEQCTSEKNTQDKWDLILRVCEEYAAKEPKSCLKAIGKRLFHKNPNVCLRSITLLDACSKNCGKAFNRELASRDFSQLVKSRFASLQRIPSIKLVEVFEKWAEEFKSDSELALAASLYSWVKSEHYEVIKHLHEDRQALKSDHVRQNAAKLQAKEEEELAKAIALSLKESENKTSATYGSTRPAPSGTTVGTSSPVNATQANTGSSRNTVYPNFTNGPTPSITPAKGRVRAVYDFEAAEDNELTFKAGELIVLLDDSDENWWRGSNHRGEGLFPAQFVKREPEDGVVTPAVTTASAPEAGHSGTPVQPKVPVQLDGAKLDECLRLISLVDPTGEFRPDPPELAQLEAECNAMAPLVDPELEKVDKRVLMLSDLNQRLLDAFQLYHDLMSRTAMPAPYYGQAYMGGYVPQLGPGAQYPVTVHDDMQPTGQSYNAAAMNPSATLMHGYATQEAIYAVPGRPGPMPYTAGGNTSTHIPTGTVPSGAPSATGLTHPGSAQAPYYPMVPEGSVDPHGTTTHSMPAGYPDPYANRYAVAPNAGTSGPNTSGYDPDARQPSGLPSSSYNSAAQPAPNPYYYHHHQQQQGYNQPTDNHVPDSGQHPSSGVMFQSTNPIG